MWEEYIYIRSIVPVLHNKFSWRLHFWACCSNLHGLNSVRGTPTFSCTKELLRCLTFASSDSEKGGDLYVKRIMITSKEPPGNPNSKGLVPSISIAYFVASTQLNHGWDLYQPLLLDRGYAVCGMQFLKSQSVWHWFSVFWVFRYVWLLWCFFVRHTSAIGKLFALFRRYGRKQWTGSRSAAGIGKYSCLAPVIVQLFKSSNVHGSAIWMSGVLKYL